MLSDNRELGVCLSKHVANCIPLETSSEMQCPKGDWQQLTADMLKVQEVEIRGVCVLKKLVFLNAGVFLKLLVMTFYNIFIKKIIKNSVY